MIELTTSGNNVLVSASHFEGFVPDSLLFLGMRSVARGKKEGCTGEYYHTLPIEHTRDYPVTVACDGSRSHFSEAARIWLAEPLIKALTSVPEKEVEVKVEQLQAADEILILNCLDFCYGHALDKLFNIQRHLKEHSNLGLLVIIHTSMRGLVPDGVSEIWQVDVPFKTFNYKISGFDEMIKSRVLRSKQAFLSRAYMKLDYSLIDIERFVRKTPFAIEKMETRPYRITFILREDRYWLTGSINNFIYLAAVKFGLMPWLKCYFIAIQNRNFRKLATRLKYLLVDSEINAIGLGVSGRLGRYIQDKREEYEIYKTHEEKRDLIYSQSHLTIGVHGSHMILSSALSGAFISLYQDYKIPHFSDDYIPRYSCPHLQSFLGRFLSDRNKPSAIAAHVRHMLLDINSAKRTKF